MTAWAGEILDQRDLLVGKGTNFLAGQVEGTDQFVLLQHWDNQKRPHAPKFDGCNGVRIAFFNVSLFCRKIGDVNRRLC